MRKRVVKGLEAEVSSGNVFADLGLRGAEKLKIKSGRGLKGELDCACFIIAV
ncbi:MAG: hypothetical protein NUV51_09045 [Sulfuricaulis sp.]|nr:hypothetical protein [Sulfuricaulis sp.]